MSKAVNSAPKRAVVAAVQLTEVSDLEFQSSLNELRELAKTLGFEVVATFTQKRARFDSTAYLGTGKREELRRFVQGEAALDAAAEESPEPPDAEEGAQQLPETRSEKRVARHGAVAAREAAKASADTETRRAAFVLVDHEISPSQARNLENEIGCD
ncbi:MAG: hypothetical protein Q8L65_04145, partial [Burkholderiales bacterium]|nr:hypothetical protein [Burkholderiales bacterium]